MPEALAAVGGIVAGVLIVGIVQLFTVMIRQREMDAEQRRIQQEEDRVALALKIMTVTGMTYEEARAGLDAMTKGARDEH